MSCAGCSLLITVGAQVVVVADQTFVTTSSEVAFKTRIAAHTFMATHYFSLRGRAYTHNCDNRTHTLSPRSVRAIFGDTVLCVASSFPSLLQQRCSYYFFLLLVLLATVIWCVTPKGDYFPPCTFHLRFTLLLGQIFFTNLAFFPPVRDFSPLFSSWGLCLLYFLAAPPTFPTKSKYERTNEREKESRHCYSLTHTHHTGRRWQSHNRVCKIFPPFCHQ